MEQRFIDHIELDDILLIKDHFSMDALKEYSDMFYSFFSGEGAKYYIGEAQRDSIPKEEYEDKVFVDFVEFAMEYARQHKEKKFILDEDKINSYRSFYGKSPETVLRKETNELTDEIETVISELNKIDSSFVNGDADAIREVLKKAEANTEITEWSRLRIINECTSALIELNI